MIKICSETFPEHINGSSRSKRQTFSETLVNSNKKNFKHLRSGLAQAQRRGLGGQQHRKLIFKRNCASNKYSRCYDGA